MMKEIKSYSNKSEITQTKLGKERMHIDETVFCKYLNPEILLKDMRLKVKMMRTLTSIFVPLRRGWRLDINENGTIRKHTAYLQSKIDNRKLYPQPHESIQYEQLIYEFYQLMLDIEDGILNWNKLRLAAFSVKEHKEVMHYLMYI